MNWVLRYLGGTTFISLSLILSSCLEINQEVQFAKEPSSEEAPSELPQPNAPQPTAAPTQTFFTTASTPIVTWAFPEKMLLRNGASSVGLVSYHVNGINRVEFFIGTNRIVTKTQEAINPITGEGEYFVDLDLTQLPDKTAVEITARVYPNGNDQAVSVLRRNVFVDRNPSPKKWYVDSSTGDDADSGSISFPFQSVRRALNSATEGDVIYLRAGQYVLNLNQAKISSRYITVENYPGENVVVVNTLSAIRPNFLKFVGLHFDFSGVTNPNANILYSWSTNNIWIKDCSFVGRAGLYNDYKTAIKFWGSVYGVTVEGSHFRYLNNAIVGSNHSLIVRKNTAEDLYSDFLDMNANDSLASGNSVKRLLPPHVSIKSLAGTFDFSGASDLCFHYDEFDNGSYTNFCFTLGSSAANISQISPQEVVSELNQDSGFYAKFEARVETNQIVVKVRRTNYKQSLYVSGGANSSLGFAENSPANEAYGSGQHSDYFQFWIDVTNSIIRNNRGEKIGQGILPQAKMKNFAVVNNVFSASAGQYWLVNFEKLDYEHVLFAKNTMWGAGASVHLQATDTQVKDFAYFDNIHGPISGTSDKVSPQNYQTDGNLYDYTNQSGVYLNSSSISTNLTGASPSPTPLFINTVSQLDSASGFYEYLGTFEIHPQSPAQDRGVYPYIKYTIDWVDRAGKVNIGPY